MLGAKMIDTSSKKLAAGFFVKFNRIVAKRAARNAERAADNNNSNFDDDDDE